MTAVWADNDAGWALLTPAGFADEGALHDLVEQTPDLLPLAGSPQLAVVGREVRLGSNKADLVAVEVGGRLCVVEVKLAANGEARRAVVAQVLSYAAYLHGLTVEQVEATVLARASFGSLAEAAEEAGQDGSFDREAFGQTLRRSLEVGAFRLVLVLDSAPAELVRTVGYLQAVAPDLIVDLITVTAYQVGDRRVLVPQRVEPADRARPLTPEPAAVSPRPDGTTTPGVEEFVRSIDDAAEAERPGLRRLADWAVELERQGLATLHSYQGLRGEVTLLPKIRPDQVGLATVWNWKGSAALSFWRSVLKRRAPQALPAIERVAAPTAVGQGTTTTAISDDLLNCLTDAYREAARTR